MIFDNYAIEKMMTSFNNYEKLNFIDVGCFNGGWINVFRSLAKNKKMFTIAIDPIRQTNESLKSNNSTNHLDDLIDHYDIFLQKAISLDPEIKDFYRYELTEYNGSLKKAISNGITFDKKDKTKKWVDIETAKFLNSNINSIEDIIKIKEIVKVECVTLKSVYDQFLMNQKIHFLKIDTQGTDMDVFLSLEKENILNNLLFVQLECNMAKNKDAQMYEGEPIFKDSSKILLNCGFNILNVRSFNYADEADVLFYNTRLVD